jgi:hypothetical protein
VAPDACVERDGGVVDPSHCHMIQRGRHIETAVSWHGVIPSIY